MKTTIRSSTIFILGLCLFFLVFTKNVYANGDFDVESDAEDLSTLIAALPDMPDPTGTKFYFYLQLNDTERVIYQKMLSATMDDHCFKICGFGDAEIEIVDSHVRRAVDACLTDNPFLKTYWDETVSIEDTTLSGCFIFTLNYASVFEPSMIAEAQAYADTIVSSVGLDGDRYTRVRKLVEIMTYEMDYEPYYPWETPLCYCVLGCLVKGYGMCVSFSDTFKFLCDRLDIPCISIGNAGHAWNFVQMENGLWYSVDTSSITLADGFDDSSEQIKCILEQLLLGSKSPQYVNNVNFHLSDNTSLPEYFTRYPDSGFQIPVLAEEQYVFSGSYVEGYHKTPYNGSQDVLSFLTKINDDGLSCTVIGVAGEQNGDLIIPEMIQGLPVTVIGKNAFLHCEGFDGKLLIPNSVVEIQENAFLGCTNLTGTLKLPQHLRRLESGAFVGCENLIGDVILPENLEYLGHMSPFYNCKNLDGTFYIPNAIEFSASYIQLTGIQELSVSSNNARYLSVDGVLYSKDRKTLLCCPGGKSGSLFIPDGVLSISDDACVRCTRLQSVHFPNSLKYIGIRAFMGCSLADDLIIPDSVQEIGYGAFSADFEDVSVNVRRLHLPKNLKRLGDWAFCNNRFSGDIFIPDSLETITDSEGNSILNAITVFYGNSFDHFVVSKNNSFFIDYCTENSAICGNDISKLRIIEPKQDYRISIVFDVNDGTYATETVNTFCGFTVPMNIIIPEREGFQFLGWADTPDSLKAMYLPDNDIFFEESKVLYAVWRDLGTTKYSIGISETANGNVTSANNTASKGEMVLLYITPDTGYELDSLTVKQGETIVTVMDNSFIMPGGDITVMATFKKCHYTIKFMNFDGTELQSSKLEYEEMPSYDGQTPKKPATEEYYYIFAGWDPEVTIVTGDKSYRATYIEIPAFGTPTVNLPASMRFIEESAFEGACMMMIVEIPEGCESIGKWAFKDCSGLTKIRIPSSVVSIDNTAFVGCTNVLVYGTSPSYAENYCEMHDNCTFITENILN